MKKIANRLLLAITLFVTTLSASAEDKDIADIMQTYNAEGTVVISSLNNDITYIHNAARANTRLTPASTFKIPNAIITLEEQVVQDQDELLLWDGKEGWLTDCNQDQTLKSAFKTSCVWFYQEVAKQVSKETYIDYLKQLNYGNALADHSTIFWLEGGGDLKISPVEQVAFLQQLYLKQLPISDKTYAILKDIMLDETHKNYTIYAKTGAATEDWVGHGWYVGYLTKDDETWFFAINILINNFEDLEKRKQIILAVLTNKGII